MTPWNELPVIVLKKAHVSQFLMPHSFPLVRVLWTAGGRVELAEENPFNIVEARSIRLDGVFYRLRALVGPYDALMYDDGFYAVRLAGVYYVLRTGREERRLPSRYEAPRQLVRKPLLEAVEGEVEARRVEVREDVFRRLVERYVYRTLEEYRLI